MFDLNKLEGVPRTLRTMVDGNEMQIDNRRTIHLASQAEEIKLNLA